MKRQRQTATSAGVGQITVTLRDDALREQCFGDISARALARIHRLLFYQLI
jgi:hypothetical protein